MTEKDKDKGAQTPAPSEGENRPLDTDGFEVGTFEENPRTSDHSSLVNALKEAFTKDREIPQPKFGMDETIEGGKYLRFGQLVNANGEPIDETGRKLKKD